MLMNIFIYILFKIISLSIESRNWKNGRVKLDISKQQFISNNDVHSELLSSIFKLRVSRDVSYLFKDILWRNYFAYLSIKNKMIYDKNSLILHRIGTPICLEQFGWSQQDTVLYYGILLGSNGILSLVYYMTAGPLSKR